MAGVKTTFHNYHVGKNAVVLLVLLGAHHVKDVIETNVNVQRVMPRLMEKPAPMSMNVNSTRLFVEAVELVSILKVVLLALAHRD